MIRVAIAEDEESYRQQIKEFAWRFSKETGTDMEIAEFTDGMQLVQNYKGAYDVIFLDIQMPQMDGFETAKCIRKSDEDVILIFVTNLAQLALKAFEVNAYDFIVKPLVYPAFEQKMKKIARILGRRAQNYIMLPVDGSMLKMPVDDIHYIEITNHRLYCHTSDAVMIMSSGTLSALEKRLEADHFSRCNSCYLVNLRHVSAIQKDSVIVGGTTLAVSRSRKKSFMKDLTEFVGRN